jgi:short-subunit dehydrogenase
MTAGERELAVVTGASSGIGLELARQFCANGFDVVVVAEDDRLADAAASLRSAGTSVVDVRADLSTYEGVETAWRAIADAGRAVDALALNAGIGAGGNFVDTSLEDDLKVVDLNVRSVVHLAKRVLPGMVARGKGRILVTASVASTLPGPYFATYAASKAFDLSFAEALNYELEDSGVTVTALLPGPTETDFFRRADLEDTKVGTEDKDDPAEVAREGFEALMAGKDHVVAGSAKNRIQVVGKRFLSLEAQAAMHARQTAPGSARD